MAVLAHSLRQHEPSASSQKQISGGQGYRCPELIRQIYQYRRSYILT
ncbi:hypothetical protein IFVP5_C270284 [Vibrio parahaemolyticus]